MSTQSRDNLQFNADKFFPFKYQFYRNSTSKIVHRWLSYFKVDAVTRKFFKWIIVKVLYDKEKYCESYKAAIFQQMKRKNKTCLYDIVHSLNFNRIIESENIDNELKEFARKIRDNDAFDDDDWKLFREKYENMRKKKR